MDLSSTLESDKYDGGKPSVPQLDVKQAQTVDPVINRVREVIQCAMRPTTAERKKEPRDVQLLLHEWNYSLSVDKDGILTITVHKKSFSSHHSKKAALTNP